MTTYYTEAYNGLDDVERHFLRAFVTSFPTDSSPLSFLPHLDCLSHASPPVLTVISYQLLHSPAALSAFIDTLRAVLEKPAAITASPPFTPQLIASVHLHFLHHLLILFPLTAPFRLHPLGVGSLCALAGQQGLTREIRVLADCCSKRMVDVAESSEDERPIPCPYPHAADSAAIDFFPAAAHSEWQSTDLSHTPRPSAMMVAPLTVEPPIKRQRLHVTLPRPSSRASALHQTVDGGVSTAVQQPQVNVEALKSLFSTAPTPAEGPTVRAAEVAHPIVSPVSHAEIPPSAEGDLSLPPSPQLPSSFNPPPTPSSTSDLEAAAISTDASAVTDSSMVQRVGPSTEPTTEPSPDEAPAVAATKTSTPAPSVTKTAGQGGVGEEQWYAGLGEGVGIICQEHLFAHHPPPTCLLPHSSYLIAIGHHVQREMPPYPLTAIPPYASRFVPYLAPTGRSPHDQLLVLPFPAAPVFVSLLAERRLMALLRDFSLLGPHQPLAPPLSVPPDGAWVQVAATGCLEALYVLMQAVVWLVENALVEMGQEDMDEALDGQLMGLEKQWRAFIANWRVRNRIVVDEEHRKETEALPPPAFATPPTTL